MQKQFCQTKMLADKEKPAEGNTLCILKGFDFMWRHFRSRAHRAPLSIDASPENQNISKESEKACRVRGHLV